MIESIPRPTRHVALLVRGRRALRRAQSDQRPHSRVGPRRRRGVRRQRRRGRSGRRSARLPVGGCCCWRLLVAGVADEGPGQPAAGAVADQDDLGRGARVATCCVYNLSYCQSIVYEVLC
jgi:hypothetical protein